MATRMRGLIHFSTILIHSFNFYLLIKIQEENFKKRFITLFIFICVIFSAGILLQEILKISKTTFLPNTNLLASFLSCGIIVSLSKLAEKKWTVYGWAPLLILWTASLLLFSRGAFISLIFGFSFLLFLNWRKLLLPLLLLIAFGIFLFLVFPSVSQRIISKVESVPDNTRAIIWQGALKSFLQKPILGWGMGTFGQVYQLNKLPIKSDIGQYEKTTRFAHNEFLEIAVEMGILGLFSFLWIIFRILRSGFRSCLSSLAMEKGWINLAAFTSIITLLVHSFFDFNLHLPILSFLFIFFSASLMSDNLSKSTSLDPPIKAVLKPILIVWITISFIVILSQSSAKLAKIKKEKGLESEATFFYKIAIVLNPFYSENIKELASLVRKEVGEGGKERENLLRRAIHFNPGDDSTHAQMARIHFSELRYEESIREYGEAIKKNPKNPFHYSDLAEVYLSQKKIDLALALYKKAVQIEPFYLLAHYRMGEIYEWIGNNSFALNSFKNILKIKEMNLDAGSDYSRRLIGFDLKLAERKIAENNMTVVRE